MADPGRMAFLQPRECPRRSLTSADVFEQVVVADARRGGGRRRLLALLAFVRRGLLVLGVDRRLRNDGQGLRTGRGDRRSARNGHLRPSGGPTPSGSLPGSVALLAEPARLAAAGGDALRAALPRPAPSRRFLGIEILIE